MIPTSLTNLEKFTLEIYLKRLEVFHSEPMDLMIERSANAAHKLLETIGSVEIVQVREEDTIEVPRDPGVEQEPERELTDWELPSAQD